MKPSKSSPKRRATTADPLTIKEQELEVAQKRIKKLEKELANRNDELDLLKEAERFFTTKK